MEAIFEAQLLAASSEYEMSQPEPTVPRSTDYVFVDPKSQHLLALIERLAVTRAAVLLQGATGRGKRFCSDATSCLTGLVTLLLH